MKPQNPFQLSQTLAHNLLRESNYSGVSRTLAGECHMRTLDELDQSDPLFHSLRRIGIVSDTDKNKQTSVVKPSTENPLMGLLRTLIDQLSQLNATLSAIFVETQSAS